VISKHTLLRSRSAFAAQHHCSTASKDSQTASTLVRRLWRIVAGLLLALPAGGQSRSNQSLPNPLTLSQAVAIALANNSTIRTAQSRLDQASGRYDQSRAVLLPQVDAYAYQAWMTMNLRGLGIEIPTVPQGKQGPFGSMDARVRLSQDILNIASLQAWKSSRSRQESSRLLVENAREIVVLNVVGAYLQALRAKAYRTALTDQAKLATDLYQITQDRVKQGVSAPLDANRAQQQVNALEQQRQEAEGAYISAKLQLANTLQAQVTSDFEVEDASAYGAETAVDKDTAISSALAGRPDYRAAAANVRAAELRVQAAKAERYPIIGTTFADGQSGDSITKNQNVYRLAANLYVPIFTSGRIRGEIAEAQGYLREAQASADQIRSQVETDVLTAIAGVEWASKEVETSAANVKLSREEVQLSRQRFTQGVTDNTEIVNAQDRVSRADDARVRALYTLGLARANLARAIGAAEKTYRK
jgi:outer membrane protein TolC